MAKAVYYPKGERQKTIIKLLNSLEGRYSRWDIWQDFIVLSAVSIANAFGGPYREQREAMYLERSKKYSTSELEVLAQMLAEVVDEMEQNPDQDMLGELFMALGLANEWKGQFFTPYDICRAMAAMNLDVAHAARQEVNVLRGKENGSLIVDVVPFALVCEGKQ